MLNPLSLPKAHLHFHLEASARPATIVEIAAQSGINHTVRTTFISFDDFNREYDTIVDYIQTPDQLSRICREIVEDNALHGVRYLEPMMIPSAYTARFDMSEYEVFTLVRDAFLDAGRNLGVETGIIIGGIWTDDLARTEAAASFAAENADKGVVAFGLCGVEPQTSYATWQRACDIARDAGLMVLPHAGEFGGPANVLSAIDDLGADRIPHGVRAIENPDAIARLAETQIACDIAPSSNVVLGVFSDYSAVPIGHFLEAGVRFTLNDDDPLMFVNRVGDEYALVQKTFGLSDNEMAAIARTSIDVSSASAETKARVNEEIDAWLAAAG